MQCDRCKRYQEKLHPQVGTPMVYYCCGCNNAKRHPDYRCAGGYGDPCYLKPK